MVMEFSDAVMDVDSHEINTSHGKQFSAVSGLNFAWCTKACEFLLFAYNFVFKRSQKVCSCVRVTCQQSGNGCMILWLLVSLQVEATGLKYCPDGDIQRGLQCIISAGAMRGLQTKCGAPLLTFGGIWKPGPGAPHSETHGHALCYKSLFSRCKEAVHPLLCPWVRYREMFLSFSLTNQLYHA